MNPHLGRRVEPLTGGWQPGDVGLCSFSVDDENSAAPSSGGGPGGESYVSLFLLPTFSKKEQFTFPPGSQVHWTTVCDALLPHSRPQPILPAAKRVWFRDTVRAIFCTIQPYSPSLQHQRYVDWEVGRRLEASCSRAQFDSATQFSSPGDLPSSTAFSRLRWQPGMPLSCVRRLLSSWQRMQSSWSLQPRSGRGFTALTSSYPRKVVTDPSWIGESWTGLCTSSRSRCWRAGAWSNASSPRIGLQRSTWRTLPFMFRSFCDTDRSYGLRSKVGHSSRGSSPSGSPCLPVPLWRS